MQLSPLIGLCAFCKHVKVIKSAKGSTFIMCNLAKMDTRLSKYPSLPVIECIGYEPVQTHKRDETSL